MNKQYLGDSVYVELNDSVQLVLTTENGLGPRNTIYMDPEVVRAFLLYIERLKSSNNAGAENAREQA